jgi:hypothetical protein
MGQTHQAQIHYLLNDARLTAAFETLEDLHSAASDNELHDVTTLSRHELLGWLKDLMFTVQETITEVERGAVPQRQIPPLRMVK